MQVGFLVRFEVLVAQNPLHMEVKDPPGSGDYVCSLSFSDMEVSGILQLILLFL